MSRPLPLWIRLSWTGVFSNPSNQSPKQVLWFIYRQLPLTFFNNPGKALHFLFCSHQLLLCVCLAFNTPRKMPLTVVWGKEIASNRRKYLYIGCTPRNYYPEQITGAFRNDCTGHAIGVSPPTHPHTNLLRHRAGSICFLMYNPNSTLHFIFFNLFYKRDKHHMAQRGWINCEQYVSLSPSPNHCYWSSI